VIKYTDLNEVFSLCSICNVAFGEFPISEISKNMINARRNRALGKSPWKIDGDNKGQV
jgi:hypothetical protein